MGNAGRKNASHSSLSCKPGLGRTPRVVFIPNRMGLTHAVGAVSTNIARVTTSSSSYSYFVFLSLQPPLSYPILILTVMIIRDSVVSVPFDWGSRAAAQKDNTRRD